MTYQQMSWFSSTSVPKPFTAGLLLFHPPGCTDTGVGPDTGEGTWFLRLPWAHSLSLSVPLGDIPSLLSINRTPHLAVISRFATSALKPLDYVSNESTERYWFHYPWYWYPLRYATCYWYPLHREPFGHWASDCNSYPSNFCRSNSVATRLWTSVSKATQKSEWMTSVVLVHSIAEGH